VERFNKLLVELGSEPVIADKKGVDKPLSFVAENDGQLSIAI
jgi:hypothetical protein